MHQHGLWLYPAPAGTPIQKRTDTHNNLQSSHTDILVFWFLVVLFEIFLSFRAQLHHFLMAGGILTHEPAESSSNAQLHTVQTYAASAHVNEHSIHTSFFVETSSCYKNIGVNKNAVLLNNVSTHNPHQAF